MNKMNRQTFFLLAATALLQACATGPSYTPLTTDSRNAIQSLEVYNLVVQDEVLPSTNIMNSAVPLGGGLLPAMIDSSVNKSRSNAAQELIKPLYEVIEDFDFRVLMAREINRITDDEYTVNDMRTIAEAIGLSNNALKYKIASLKEGEALLYVLSSYRLVDDSRHINTSTVAMLYRHQPAGKATRKGLPKPAYANVFNYQSPKIGGGGADSIAQWSEDSGARFREIMEQAAELTANALAYDMQTQRDEACLRTARAAFATQVSSKATVQGKLISYSDERSLLRSRDGALHSSPEVQTYINVKQPAHCTKGTAL